MTAPCAGTHRSTQIPVGAFWSAAHLSGEGHTDGSLLVASHVRTQNFEVVNCKHWLGAVPDGDVAQSPVDWQDCEQA